MADIDKVFAGSIPKIYEGHMVPLIFEPYARDIAERLRGRKVGRLLEIAAGTGVVTRAMSSALGPGVQIVATDLNQAMLDEAAARGTAHPVEWKRADAMNLPFGDASFDAVVCQFGMMFMPDKAKAHAQVFRVLQPGGIYIFNVWDRIEDNELTDVVTQALAGIFAHDPPRFMARTPHGYHDRATILRDLQQGGFTAAPLVETVAARSPAPDALHAAIGICQGTPLRTEIEARGAPGLAEATARAAEELAKRFGRGPVDARIQAIVVTAQR